MWKFGECPTAVGMWFGECDAPLSVNWECSAPHHACSVAVDGMPDWRTPWGRIRMLHQMDVEPAREIRVKYRVGPA